MTDNELRLQGPPIELDNTMRVQFRECPRKLYWFMRGFTWKGKPAYFISGSSWHIFIEEYYLTAEADRKERIVGSIEKAYAFYRANIGEAIPSDKDKWDSIEQLMLLYADIYRTEPWKMISGETGWLWPVDSRRMYGGSLDGYIEWPGYGTLAIEQKTVGMYLSDSYIAQWSFSPQVTGIIWGLSEHIGGEIFGCLMNLASKVLPGPKSKRTTPQFTRRLEKRSQARLIEFKDEVLRDFDLLEAEWLRWSWPMSVNPIECVGGIGKKPCLFKDVCTLPIHFTQVDPLEFSYIGLRAEKWEPWKRTKGEDK